MKGEKRKAMKITLRTMNPEEFQRYMEFAIENLVKEQVTSGNWQEKDAIFKARKEHERLLPGGVNSAHQYLYTICAGDENVGMLWLAIKDEQKGFIYDVNIWKQHQGKGYGKNAMKQIETIAKDLGLQKIELHVFGHNKMSRRLYEKLGYIETNIKMEKQL